MRAHGRAALVVAHIVLANRADAEDVCQESWIKALEHIEECRDPSRFVFWLLQIVRNQARNRIEHRRVRQADPLESLGTVERPFPTVDPRPQLEQRGTRVELERAVADLTEPLREVLLLHDLEGWNHTTIAERLAISEVLSRQRLFQARRRLRVLLRQFEEGNMSHERFRRFGSS